MHRKQPSILVCDGSLFSQYIQQYVEHLAVRNFSAATQENRHRYLTTLYHWLRDRGIDDPRHVTRLVLEGYQRHLYRLRKQNGEPHSARSQYCHLVPVRVFFKWLCKQRVVLHNPAGELELPKLRKALPPDILTEKEVEILFSVPNINTTTGLRDRTILELIYSTGVRRKEVVALSIYDIEPMRKIMRVREGKGDKERFVPIGQRALYWVGRYQQEARPHLLGMNFYTELFITNKGKPFVKDSLSHLVRKIFKKSGVPKKGGCHLLRHTMSTLMHENGASIRVVQEILGHENLSTTETYTRVTIKHTRDVYAKTHPTEKKSKAALDGEEKH